ncbi:brain-derived neurotrophic factor-like isoform X2 [Branchiostoma lanceolatum]|uniref:brain-derived neurotrophic factor-like isoform X2 n=1 Tax=Branchiostoma lanceolatum TaxID=7740 RepID=UPI003453FD38
MKGLIRSCIVPHIVLVFICTSCSALPAVVLDGNLDDLRKRTEIRERRGSLRHLFENYSPHVRDNVLLQDDLVESKIFRPSSPQKFVNVHMFNFTDLMSSPLFMSPHLSFRRTTSYPSHGQDLRLEFSKTLARSKRTVHAGQEVSVCDEIQEYKVFNEPLSDYQGHIVEVLQEFRTPDLNAGEYVQQLFIETRCNLSQGSETSNGCRGIDKTHWTSSCVAKRSNVPAIVRWNGKLNVTFIAIRTSCNCALKKKPRSANSEFIKAEITMCNIFQQTLAEVAKEQENAEGEGQGRGEVGEETTVDNVDDNNGRKSETSTASGSAEDAEERKERRRHQRPTSKESKKNRRRRRRRRQKSRERRIRRKQDNPPTDLSSPNRRTSKKSRRGSN